MIPDDTAVALLTINLFKKELLQSADTPSVCLALSCMASMVTPDIARDLQTDVLLLLSSTKPQIRRRAVYCLFRMFLKYPPALLSCYPKIKDLLSDSDLSVVSSAVSIILELALRNPKNYIRLAPTLHKLISPPLSNWVSLKVLKLFRLLCPLEARLPPKLHVVLLEFLQDQNLGQPHSCSSVPSYFSLIFISLQNFLKHILMFHLAPSFINSIVSN